MGEENWIPEPLRDAPFFKAGEGESKTPEQVLADLNNAAQHLGNSLRIPAADAGPEAAAEAARKAAERMPDYLMVRPNPDDQDAMGSIFATLGRPNEASEYRLPEIEGVDWEGQDLSKVKANAHAMNLTQDQFAAMVSEQVSTQSEASRASQEALDADLEALKGEWGAAYEQRRELISGLLKSSEAPEYLSAMLVDGKLPARDMKWLYAMADAMGSEGSELSAHGREEAIESPDQARIKIHEIMNRADKAMWEPSHPQYEYLNKERVRLMGLVNPR